jgi:hypothetical protein
MALTSNTSRSARARPGDLASLTVGFPKVSALVSDGVNVAWADPALSMVDPSLGNRVSVISTAKGGAVVDLVKPSDQVKADAVIAIQGGLVYFTGIGVNSVPIAGGAVKTVTPEFAARAAVTASYAFIATSGANTSIIAVPLAGGAEIT